MSPHIQLSQRSHHLNISHENPKTNILSPALMSNPRLHNIGMALLTPNTSSVFPDCNSPQQGMAGRWTENRPLCLSFRLNPWLFSQTLKHLQVWDGQHGSEEVTSGHSASPFTGRTLTSISPVSPPPSHFTILSGSGNLEGIQLSLLINQFCLHRSNVIDRQLNMLTVTF